MFSVIIPLYNKENSIIQTVQTVLNQSYQNFEIIIVNDGSTDGSFKKVKKISDDRIKLIDVPNGGVSFARNIGIKNSSFDYIAFLDADDSWEDNHLDNINNLIKTYPSCDVFSTNYKIIDSNNKVRLVVNTKLIKLINSKNKEYGILDNYFYVASRTAPPLWTSAIVVSKKALLNVGLFPIGVKQGEDLITWAKLALNYNIAYSLKVSANYHYWTLDELTESLYIPDSDDFVGNELKKLYISNPNKELKKYIAQWHKMRMHMFVLKNERIKATSEMIKLLSYDLWNKKSYFLFFSLIFPLSLRKYLFSKIYQRLIKYKENNI